MYPYLYTSKKTDVIRLHTVSLEEGFMKFYVEENFFPVRGYHSNSILLMNYIVYTSM